MSFIAIYITHPNEVEAKKIVTRLLNKKLIACANIFPISSSYWWQAAIVNEQEWVSIVKTTNEKWAELQDFVGKIHPYDVPCIMKYQVSANTAYEQWIHDAVSSD